MWEVEFTNEFERWWRNLSQEQQEAVSRRVGQLEQLGPALGRPAVDTLVGSRVPNLKELRTSSGGALRVLFVFDPLRTAILLLGGDKTGRWKQWYEEAIPQAERLYEEHLSELRAEGSINDDKA